MITNRADIHVGWVAKVINEAGIEGTIINKFKNWITIKTEDGKIVDVDKNHYQLVTKPKFGDFNTAPAFSFIKSYLQTIPAENIKMSDAVNHLMLKGLSNAEAHTAVFDYFNKAPKLEDDENSPSKMAEKLNDKQNQEYAEPNLPDKHDQTKKAVDWQSNDPRKPFSSSPDVKLHQAMENYARQNPGITVDNIMRWLIQQGVPEQVAAKMVTERENFMQGANYRSVQPNKPTRQDWRNTVQRADKCPECNSTDISHQPQAGKFHCKNCGNNWSDVDKEHQDTVASDKSQDVEKILPAIGAIAGRLASGAGKVISGVASLAPDDKEEDDDTQKSVGSTARQVGAQLTNEAIGGNVIQPLSDEERKRKLLASQEQSDKPNTAIKSTNKPHGYGSSNIYVDRPKNKGNMFSS